MILRGFVLCLLLAACQLCYAQVDQSTGQYGTVQVKIFDAETNQPIPYANVYINRTTIGGYTDDKGEATIKRIPNGTHELVITSISHKPQQRKLIIKPDQTVYITVKLLPRLLNEVTVRAKRDAKWERQFTRFQRLFFGNQHFKQCVISNPWVLNFKTVKGDFLAEANEPLKIENNFLGYNLDFDIRMCAFNSSKFIINGLVKFEEKQGSDSLRAIWKKNREDAYRGSAQHFLRSAVNGSETRIGYDLYSDITSNADIIRGSTFLRNVGFSILHDSLSWRVKPTDDGLYTIQFPSRLEIHYMPKRAKMAVYRDVFHPVSWMEVKDHTLTVSRDGIVQNPGNLTVLGAMSDLRVADWLPLDFIFVDPYSVVPVEKPDEEIKVALLEKPYVQTDRDYYYNNETIWLKGYMNYSIPLLKDTLSQSVYVEFVDKTNTTLVTRRYRLEGGSFHGDIPLDNDWAAGAYQIKVYTAWMLNFDPQYIFTKTISLLGEKEAVRIASDYKLPTDTLTNILMKTDKATYAPREKIIVTIDVIDSLGFSTPSDLSMAVTDLNQAVPQKNEKTIVKDFAYDVLPPDSTVSVRYNIEYGIGFNGQFWLGKKPVKASITVFQDSIRENFAIITDDAGKFERTLLFKDTLNFYLSAMSYNNKKGRVLMDTVRPRPPHLEIEPLSLDIFSSDDANRRRLNLSGVTMLEEVSVKASRIIKSPVRPVSVIHGSADYTVTGDWINERNFTDVLFALSTKVPGLRYICCPNPSLSLNTGQFSRFQSGGGSFPLILVDGVAVQDLRQVLDIPIRSIDFVDVLKYGGSASYGSRGAGGVIAIFTKKWTPRDPNDKSFDKSKLQTIKWAGFTTPATFIAPDYSQPSFTNDYYDYRATLHWAPSVLTTGNDPATVSFYAGDVATKYRIIVEGVTSGGQPVRAEKIIEIVNGR